MTTVSKNIFSQIVGDKTCRDFMHPWHTNCSDAWKDMCRGSMKGSLKFFIIIYAAQWLMKYKRMNTKKYFKEQMIYFTRSYIYGICMATTFVTTFCLTRKLLGKFYYYTAVIAPGFFAGLAIFLENRTMKTINTILFFNMVLETAVSILRRDGVLIRSTTVDTAFFMLTNAAFMYLFSANQLASKATLLWFFDPRQSKSVNNQQGVNGCCEKNKCRKHILQDSLKYFAFGYGFQAMKSFLPGILSLVRKPRQLVSALINKKSFLFGSFIGSYVLIYKLVCRELYKMEGRSEHKHQLLAGLLAGISYSFNPNITMALMPTTLILQICWLNIHTIYKLPDWPFTEIFFALCNGFLFHARLFLPDCCPQYVHNLIHAVPNGMADPMIENFVKEVNRTIHKQ